MIKRVIITNYLGESVTINLSDEEPEHGFLITEIKGLGPPGGDINTTDLAISDGSIFNFAKLKQRNIVIYITLTMAPTIEDSRQRSYKYFPMKKPLELLIETDNRRLKCVGYVEKNDPDIFSKDENIQVSIICPDPYLYSIYENETVFSGLESLFEFPFSNEIEIKHEPIEDTNGDPILDTSGEKILDRMPDDENRHLEFSNIVKDQQKNVFYEGDSDTGVVICLHFLGHVEDITIYNTGTREKMHIDTEVIESIIGSVISLGDSLRISTVRKNKTVTFIRGDEETNVLNSLDRGSVWLQLTKGDNWFAYVAKVGSGNIQFNITNQTLYEGI